MVGTLFSQVRNRPFSFQSAQVPIGWHTDTISVTVLMNDSTFKSGHRLTKVFRTAKKIVVSSSMDIYDMSWKAIRPEDIYSYDIR